MKSKTKDEKEGEAVAEAWYKTADVGDIASVSAIYSGMGYTRDTLDKLLALNKQLTNRIAIPTSANEMFAVGFVTYCRRLIQNP